VGPGRNRDYLMGRIFQLEVINILPRLAAEPDPVAQRAGFEVVKSWVDRWYTKPIAYRLSPLHRIAINLMKRGMMEEALALFPEWPPARPWNVIVDGNRVFADYPYFRDRALGVPDDCYEITRRLKAHCHIDDIARSDGASASPATASSTSSRPSGCRCTRCFAGAAAARSTRSRPRC